MSHLRTDKERAMQFRRGFGDGAKSGAFKWPDDDDYLAGHARGRAAVLAASEAYKTEVGLDYEWSILRLAEEGPGIPCSTPGCPRPAVGGIHPLHCPPCRDAMHEQYGSERGYPTRTT